MDQYLDQIDSIIKDGKTSSTMCLKLQEIMDLRQVNIVAVTVPDPSRFSDIYSDALLISHSKWIVQRCLKFNLQLSMCWLQLLMTCDQACNYCVSVLVRIIGNHKMRTKLSRLKTKAQKTRQQQRRRNFLKSLNSPSPRKKQEKEPE